MSLRATRKGFEQFKATQQSPLQIMTPAESINEIILEIFKHQGAESPVPAPKH